jgi:hypothetical protein
LQRLLPVAAPKLLSSEVTAPKPGETAGLHRFSG